MPTTPVSIILGKRDRVESKFALGTTSVITILFSLVIGFGVSGYAGIPLAQISPLAIFVVLGMP